MPNALVIAALVAAWQAAPPGNPISRHEWLHGRSEMSAYSLRYGNGVGSLYFMRHGDGPGSFYYAAYGDEPGSIYYWRYGRAEGSRYFWRFGRTPGSAYFWRYGNGCLSQQGWSNGGGDRCGPKASPILLTLCIARVLDIEPCAAIDPELDAWVARRDSSSGFRLAERLAEVREDRPTPE